MRASVICCALLLLASCARGSDRELQECEMCGLLVYTLELLKAGIDAEMEEKKAAHDAATKKRGVLGELLAKGTEVSLLCLRQAPPEIQVCLQHGRRVNPFVIDPARQSSHLLTR